MKRVALGLLLATMIVLCACGAQASPAQTNYDVDYRVTGVAKAQITYTTREGGIEQTTVALPWRRRFRAPSGTILVLTAQNQGDTGVIRVEILLDGEPWKRSRSDGPYAIAECNGILP